MLIAVIIAFAAGVIVGAAVSAMIRASKLFAEITDNLDDDESPGADIIQFPLDKFNTTEGR